MKKWLFVLVAISSAVGCVQTWDRPDHLTCTSDGQCPADERCLAWNFPDNQARCVPQDACNEKADCNDGESCLSGHCGTPECEDDDACSPYTCDAGAGRCRTSCSWLAEGTQLPTDPAIACGDKAGCTSAGDCQINDCDRACSPYICRGTACLTSCQGDRDCASGKFCSRGSCGLKGLGADCASPAECESGACDAYGSCVDPCAGVACGDYDGHDCGSCPTGYSCSYNYCVDTCEDGVCVDACEAVECGISGGVDCGECDDGQVCTSDNVCRGAAGSYCVSDYECASDLCCYGYTLDEVCAATYADCF